jgi:hypothetical protein
MPETGGQFGAIALAVAFSAGQAALSTFREKGGAIHCLVRCQIGQNCLEAHVGFAEIMQFGGLDKQ